ncbi:MAG: dihydrodipicolinate synthase family protein [Vicinamibacterales bacterium]
MAPLAGLYTPIATPFRNDALDDAALRRNVERYMQTRLTGLVVLGSNGEAVMLDDSEAERAVAAARSAMPSSRPLIAGTGAESTRGTIAATLRAANAGADAVLVRTPAFFKNMMNADVYVRHYTAVAEASPVPVLLYNVSMFTGVTLPPDAVGLLAEHPNIVGMKESGSDAALLSDYIARSSDSFFVLAGSGLTFFNGLVAGAQGGILALAGVVPDLCAELFDHVRAQRYDEARALQRRLTPLARTIGGLHGVPALKAALDLMGYEGGLPRAPLGPAPKSVVETLRRLLTDLGVPLAQPALEGDPATT